MNSPGAFGSGDEQQYAVHARLLPTGPSDTQANLYSQGLPLELLGEITKAGFQNLVLAVKAKLNLIPDPQVRAVVQ